MSVRKDVVHCGRKVSEKLTAPTPTELVQYMVGSREHATAGGVNCDRSASPASGPFDN